MKEYPSYKNSGVEWVGELPSHWHVMPLKYAAIVNREALTKQVEDNYELQYIDIGNVNQLGIINPPEHMKFANAPSRARRIIKKNDTIISTVRTYLKAVAFIHRDDDNLIASTGFATLTSRNGTHPKYLYYLVSNQGFVDTVSACSTGVSYPAITSTELARITAWLPPLIEQQAIADFLDRKTSQIDELITKKQRQIDLLHKQRTALINQAVTKGLNPDAPMKDSGVEWLGEIPSHWEVIRLKHLSRDGLRNGIFKKKDKFGSGTKLINVSDLYQDNYLVNYENLDRVQTDENELETFGVSPGDIFFVRSSLKLEGVGQSVCIIETPEPTVFECHVVKTSPDKKKIEPLFLIHFLNSYIARHRLIASAETVTMTTLRQSKISSLEITVPPHDEQLKVIDFLMQANEKTYQAIDKIVSEIEKLNEYHTALISAAVTGKIDVREEH